VPARLVQKSRIAAEAQPAQLTGVPLQESALEFVPECFLKYYLASVTKRFGRT
jgi:hypothetical protein